VTTPRRNGKRPLSPEIETYDRQTFYHDIWDYAPGEHVTILAPTGGGKTQIAYELLGYTAKPTLQAVVLVMKPRDDTVDKFTKRYKFKVVRDWPPPRLRILEGKPPGYVLWPKEYGDPAADDARHTTIFSRAIRDLYRKGNKITFADETYSLEKEMGLSRDLVRVWTKGRSMGDGLWAASQRPAWISQWAYQAHHLFLANDPDQRTQERYGDIGAGFDPRMIIEILNGMQRFQFLYINRDDRSMCIVDAN